MIEADIAEAKFKLDRNTIREAFELSQKVADSMGMRKGFIHPHHHHSLVVRSSREFVEYWFDDDGNCQFINDSIQNAFLMILSSRGQILGLESAHG